MNGLKTKGDFYRDGGAFFLNFHDNLEDQEKHDSEPPPTPGEGVAVQAGPQSSRLIPRK